MSEIAKLPDAAAIEKVLIGGDLSALTETQRTNYYMQVCNSVGLNPLTKPFEYLKLNGKLQLYARKDCTDQLRTLHKVSIVKMERETIEGVYVCTAYARDADGREDVSTGAVPIDKLAGEFRANAMMKAETKSKRRVTLSICGLGMLDETEIESIPNAQPEPPPALPPKAPGSWGNEVMERLREKERKYVSDGKCVDGELIGLVGEQWEDAKLPHDMDSWTKAQRAVGMGIAKAVIDDLGTRQVPSDDGEPGLVGDACEDEIAV